MKGAVTSVALVCLSVLAAMLSGAAMLDRNGYASTPLDAHAAAYLDLAADLAALDPESVDFLIRGTVMRRSPVPSFASIAERSRALAAEVRASKDSTDDAARARALEKQLSAIAMRSTLQAGARVSFANELDGLFALELSQLSRLDGDAAAVRQALARRLPGTGPLAHRLSQYQSRFVVPRAHLHDVITQSLAACRNQTKRFLTLPEGEAVSVKYVADRPWSGYSVYRGNYDSVMLVNRTMPLSVAQALNLACHEGYPGHHAYNTLRDQHLVRAGNRLEARTLLIFSPDGFLAEALAAAAAAMAFSVEERSRLYRRVLFPVARLNPDDADTYAEICDLLDRLTVATTPILRRYLSGELGAVAAAASLEREALMEHPEGLLGYVDRYRWYALAYTWGRDHVLATLTDPALGVEDRWRLVHAYMTSPRHQDDLFAAR